MTQSVIKLSVTAEDRRVAWLATAAVGLSLVDAAIPSPLPGVKPGLANIVTLVVLARYGWGTAVWVSALRVLAGSLLLGYFLAPGFFLSLSGALASLVVLGLAMHLPARWFGPVSHSILAAFAHIGAQLVVVTRGEHGASAFSAAGEVSVPGHEVPVRDTVGAGDTFHAALLARLARGGRLGGIRTRSRLC